MAPPIKKWTPNDEAQLQRLLQAKAEFDVSTMKPLLAMIDKMYEETCEPGEGFGTEDMADFLVKHADEIRDLLSPFDSGVRAAPSNSTIR